MKPKYRHPNWGRLYLTLPLMIGLLVLAHQAKLSPGQEKLAQAATVLLCFGLIGWWINANSAAIVHEQLDEMAEQRRPGQQSAPPPVGSLERLEADAGGDGNLATPPQPGARVDEKLPPRLTKPVFQYERRQLRRIAVVNGVLLGCVAATVFLAMSPLIQLLLSGVALVGQMLTFFLLALAQDRRRLREDSHPAGRFRFKRYPQAHR
jgi:hypothetical protein